MMSGNEQTVLGEGTLLGMSGGICLALSAVVIADALGASARGVAMHPTVVTLGIAPLICLVCGVQALRRAEAAE